MGRKLKAGLTLDVQTPSYGGGIGETFYIICDNVGVVFQTIHPGQLDRFYVEDADYSA